MDKAQAQTTQKEEIEVEKGKTRRRNEKHDVYVYVSRVKVSSTLFQFPPDRLRGLPHTYRRINTESARPPPPKETQAGPIFLFSISTSIDSCSSGTTRQVYNQ